MILFVAADFGVALLPDSAQLMTVEGIYPPPGGATQSVQLAMCRPRKDKRPTPRLALDIIRAEFATLRRRHGGASATAPRWRRVSCLAVLRRRGRPAHFGGRAASGNGQHDRG